ncbi:MAG: cell division protein FtsZ [Bacteroidetes bacterium]|nr:cell division protein FtsZ [Bacteroidota bacterium]MBL6943318.1 cell division protein FtsZ [Bacteroidales bacterium]
MITFQPKQHPSIIKVLGVGGGGSNAVNHMFKQGITGVDFAVCNTDVQALESSPVPTKIQIGNKGGLGAGANPEIGRTAAEDSIDKIKELLDDENTQMLFITAGMGGGTGTGAAPVIAKLAREMGILTVGIVTLPFGFEGRKRKQQAELGISKIKQYVDALLVISNDKLREQFGDLVLGEAFAQADNVLTSAAKGIAELITVTGYVNVDFEDVRTVIKDSGKAIMGSAKAEGEHRAERAIEAAMNSPLLNDNEIAGATDILLYITTGEEDITMDEITEITDYVQKESGSEAETIWGVGKDESLGKKIGITIIATGFDNPKNGNQTESKIVGVVGDKNEPIKSTVSPTPSLFDGSDSIEIKKNDSEKVSTLNVDHEDSKIVHTLSEVENKDQEQDVTAFQLKVKPISLIRRSDEQYLSIGHTVSSKKSEPKEETKHQYETDDEIMAKNAAERVSKLMDLSINLRTPDKVVEYEKEPAYVRKNVKLDDVQHSSDSAISRYTLGEDSKNQPVIKSDNSFLHDNVD